MNKNYFELLKELDQEKKNNKDLLNELNKEKNKVKELNDKIKLLGDNNDYIKRINELEKIINIKNNELNNLKSKLNNDNSIDSINPGERIIAISFVSSSQDFHLPMPCKNTEIIARLEEKLYNEYPKYKDCHTYLTVNGTVIKRFKTIDENGIKNGNTIIVNIYDE